MGEDVADSECGAADGRNGPERLLGFGREMIAEQEAGAVGGDVAECGAGDLGGHRERSDGAVGEGDAGDVIVAVVDGGGEEADAVGSGGGEALHSVDTGGEVAAVGELRDVRRGDGSVLVTSEIAGDEGDDEKDHEDGQGAPGGSQDFGISRGGVRRESCRCRGNEAGIRCSAVERGGRFGLGNEVRRGCMQDIYRRDEAIASFGECLDKAGTVGGVAEGFADLVDGGAEGVVEVNDRVTTPETQLELLPGDDLAGVLEERGENFKGCVCSLIRKPAFQSSPLSRSTSKSPKVSFELETGAGISRKEPRGVDCITRCSDAARVDRL